MAVLPARGLAGSRLRHVAVRHEQGAGHAAEGYAQATGRVGVCMATSGPGATNTVNITQDQIDRIVQIVQLGTATVLAGPDVGQRATQLGVP